MNETNRCPKCGQPVPQDAPEGLCPRCVGALNLDSETGPTGSGAAGPPPPSARELAPHFPQLEILELIGQGGMGVVYKVRQKELERIAALKVLPPGIGGDPAFAERFAREAKALARLNHPGIVTIYDSGRTNGLFYFLMEYVDGVSLGRLMRAGRMSPREALAIVPQLCDALQYAHDQGIVHRDIKPENILLDRQGRVKVADFGLAKLLGTADESAAQGAGPALSPGLTGAGKVVGTPRYMAPEQAEHPAGVDHRADIYALGVVFYQMLTGELPGQRLEAPSRKVQVDVRLDEVVLRALEKEPERRYQQVSQVKTAVETILQTAAAERGAKQEATQKTERTDALRGEAGPKREGTLSKWLAASIADGDKIQAFLDDIVTPSGARGGPRAAGGRKHAYLGIAVGIAAALALLFCLRLVLRARAAAMEARVAEQLHVQAGRNSRENGLVKQVSAATARQGDIGVWLQSLGTVASSNSVMFPIPQDNCQEVVRKFDAHQALSVEAYDRQWERRFGHGSLAGVNNQVDTQTGTFWCRARLIPEGDNLMIPGLFLNIRLLLEMRHGVTLVPAMAIQRDPESVFVWVIQSDHRVTRRPVSVGVEEGKWAEIQSGLSPGEVVASDGFNFLREGLKVRYDLAPMAGSAQASPQPGGQQAGARATLNVTAGGTAPPSCQWTSEGTNLAGATNGLARGVNTPTNKPPASP